MTNSRAKGKAGELEAVHALAAIGIDASRTAQHCGNAPDGAADHRCPDFPVHVEVKRYKRIAAIKFLNQARRDATTTGHGRPPLVLMRQNGDTRWVAMLELSDLPAIAEAYATAIGKPVYPKE